MSEAAPVESQSTGLAPLWGHLLALGWVMLWGPNFALMRSLELHDGLAPASLLVLRFGIAAPLVLAVWIARRPDFSRLGRRGWMVVLFMFLVIGPCYHLMLAVSAVHVKAGLIGVLMATMPVHAGWFGVLVLGERFGWKSAAAVAVALTGVTLPVLFEGTISLDNFTLDHLAGDDRSLAGLIYPLMLAANAVIAAMNNVLVRYLRHRVSAWDLVCGQTVLTLPVALVAVYVAGADTVQELSAMDLWGWLKGLHIGSLGLLLMNLMVYKALQTISAVAVCFYTFVMLATGWAWGWILLDESMSPVHVTATLFVAAGLVLNTWGAIRWRRNGDINLASSGASR